MKTFVDRHEAAELLSAQLKRYKNCNGIVMAIPRGGVPVGYVIAQNLHLPLDMIMIKKIGHPFNHEFAIGAVSIEGRILNDTEGVTQEYIDRETQRIRKSLRERYLRFTGHAESHNFTGKTVIIVDDGVATGNTILAAIALARKSKPEKIVVATPVCSISAAELIRNKADDFISVLIPEDLYAIGQFYESFEQVEDDEVMRLLQTETAEH